MNGKVILVGAGPGNAGLMTILGKQVLETADVVLYDRLVSEEILELIPDSAHLIDVGKSNGRHPIAQDKINALLLKHAKEGKTVVRLKGGDPYLFGRGAEELEAVIRENIPFEVVPGVTSAIAAASYAGIPVSHRDYSSSVHIITAHKKNGETPDLDFQSLVNLNGTLVFLMGIAAIETVTMGLIKAGMPPETPAALVENGTRFNQRKLVSTLADISKQGKVEGFAPPSILVVGNVCSLHEKLDWVKKLPLHNIKIINTRPANRSALSQKLRESGAHVIDFPCISAQPLTLPDRFFEEINLYNWLVFTSPTGAKIFIKEIRKQKFDIRLLSPVKIATIGEKTAQAFTECGIIVDYIPTNYNARELGENLPCTSGDRVLLFRAKDGTPELINTLQKRGFTVKDVPVYKTILEKTDPEQVKQMLDRSDIDFITFTSASTVKGFAAATSDINFDRSGLKVVCIGEETAAEAKKHGYKTIVSKQATIESMIEIIIEERER